MVRIVLDDLRERHPETPEEAHQSCRFGVQLILQDYDGLHGPVRDVLCNFEYYFHCSINKRWMGTHDPFSALTHHAKGEPVLHGSMVSDKDWQRLKDKYLHT